MKAGAAGISLRARYAVSGTDIAYEGTSGAGSEGVRLQGSRFGEGGANCEVSEWRGGGVRGGGVR
eukprot:650885-Rhodomonas_salina.1